MARGDVRHSGRRVDRSARTGSGRLLRRATAALVVLVLVLAGVSYTFDLGTRWLGWDYPSPVTEPAAVAPPPGRPCPRRPSRSRWPCPATRAPPRTREGAPRGRAAAAGQEGSASASRWRWTSSPTAPGVPVRAVGGHPGVDDEAAHLHRGARLPRPGTHVQHDGGGRRHATSGRAGRGGTRCSRAPRAATTPTRPGPTCSPWRRPPAPRPGGRHRVSSATTRRCSPARRSAPVARVVPARRRGLADLGAVGRRGPGASGDGPVGRPRPRRGPGVRAGTRQAGDRGRGAVPPDRGSPSPTCSRRWRARRSSRSCSGCSR